MEYSTYKNKKILSSEGADQELVVSDVCIPSEVATMDKNKDPILEKLMCAD